MAITALKCPSCAADIQVDDDREYSFCSYCGTKIKTREVVEIRYTSEIQINDKVSFDKQMEDGIAYLKMEYYYKAEKAFLGVIKDYPGKPEGYEMLINTITRNMQVFYKETMERVTRLANDMVNVAPEEKKDYYRLLRERIDIGFENGRKQQQIDENLKSIGKYNKMINENKFICISFLILSVIVGILWPTVIECTFTFICVAIGSGSAVVGLRAKNKQLLSQNEILEKAMKKE